MNDKTGKMTMMQLHPMLMSMDMYMDHVHVHAERTRTNYIAKLDSSPQSLIPDR